MEQLSLLYNFWERISAQPLKKSGTAEDTEAWRKEVSVLYTLGLGMEETIRFLYFNNPSYEEFKNWVGKTGRRTTLADLSCNGPEIENVLTTKDLDFWKQNGYVVLRNVIPKQQCIDTQKAIWEFLDMNKNDPSSWYRAHEEKRGLMLMLTHHPTLDANRESLKIRKAYEQLYASTKIYKTIDKVSFNPPETNHFHFMGSKLHWDVSLELPIPFCLQGLLYLTNCGPDDGAFHCVPGFHTKIEGWLKELPPGINPREAALSMLKPIPVSGEAGDFIIWHQALPHCATANRGLIPRMVQYLTYLPQQYEIQKKWK